MPRKIDEDMEYLSSVFGGGGLEVFGIYRTPLSRQFNFIRIKLLEIKVKN